MCVTGDRSRLLDAATCWNGSMTGPLIDPHSLHTELETASVFDLRWKLGEPGYGRSAYLEGHIPGAIFVDLDKDLSAPPGARGRHPLPGPEDFRRTLERLGVRPESNVVVYDDAGGMVAARMWWMLESIGHHNVMLLDGGLQSWIEAGYQLETIDVTPTPTEYPGPLTFGGVVDIDDLQGREIVDVRAPDRYSGEVEPVDPRSGHIPGAINIPASSALVGKTFASPEDLGELYRHLDDPVFSCGSGVNACHSALAVVASGRTRPDVYIGSFSEWSRSHKPVATGTSPA
jgi:thiosulfate/3-mercaptopyruvate sulfurtransferase